MRHHVERIARYKEFFGICSIILLGISTFIAVGSEDKNGWKYYFDVYDIEVVENAGVDTAYPYWAEPNPQEDKTDLSYWVNDVLPYDEDKDADMFLVYAKAGIIVPIYEPTYEDQMLINQGKEFNHFPYLAEGALHYFGSSPAYERSNMVIASHSSYEYNDQYAGNYNTIFQALPISRAGDKVFLYIKNDEDTYDFYEYEIEKSFETDPSNVSVLVDTPTEYTLTTYGCYPIGSTKYRWVNQATLTKKIAAHSSLQEHAVADEQPSEEASDEESAAEKKQAIIELYKKLYSQKIENTETTTETYEEDMPTQDENDTTSTNSQASSTYTVETAVANVVSAKPMVDLFTKLKYQKRVRELKMTVLVQVKFHRGAVAQFLELLDDKIDTLVEKEQTDTEKYILFTLLREELEGY